MKELYRVLKPGGWASLQVPIKGDITKEDLSVTDPKERLRLYGQDDHVRYYGRDFADRLKSAGFDVLIIPKDYLVPERKPSILEFGVGSCLRFSSYEKNMTYVIRIFR